MACNIFRVGVFFDGTGNNSKYDSSDGRDQQSNIAKLSNLYKKGTYEIRGKNVICDMIYEKGIGTYDTQAEHNSHPIQRKYDKGGGGGGSERIEDAINKVKVLLTAHPYSLEDPEKYKKRIIDVFGFSRGAAEARDFVNTFYEDEYPTLEGVNFNFIGIYDTVGSFGKPGNNIDMKSEHADVFNEANVGFDGDIEDYFIEEHNTDKVRTKIEKFDDLVSAKNRVAQIKDYGIEAMLIPSYGLFSTNYYVRISQKESEAYTPYNFNLDASSANKIVHFTAHDEVRKNFPLTNIIGSGGLECRMIGVHSDVGGGYPPEKEELHEFPYRGHWKRVNEVAKEKAQELTGLGGAWSVKQTRCARNGIGTMVLSRKILNNLANVTLHLMHEEATSCGVPFKTLPNDENHKIHDDLQSYYTYAKQNLTNAHQHNYSRYMSSEKGGKYMRTDDYLNTNDGQKISAGQIHHSSADPAQKRTNYVGNTKVYDDAWKKDSADGSGNDMRYTDINSEQVNGRDNPKDVYSVEREIYTNNPSKAITPS